MPGKKSFITFVCIITMIIFLCVPVLNRAEDDEKPPEGEQLPTVSGTVNY